MRYPDLIEDAALHRFGNGGKTGYIRSGPNYEQMMEFINNYIDKQLHKCSLLKRLSDMYVLLGRYASERWRTSGEASWSELFPDDQAEDLAFLKKHGYWIMGVLLISEQESRNPFGESIEYIEWIDTRLKGYNIAKLMMDRYKKRHKVDLLLPFEIVPEAVYYWMDRSSDVEDVRDDRGLRIPDIPVYMRDKLNITTEDIDASKSYDYDDYDNDHDPTFFRSKYKVLNIYDGLDWKDAIKAHSEPYSDPDNLDEYQTRFQCSIAHLDVDTDSDDDPPHTSCSV
jgi:hypothetical protein